jgi:hypothetical protein
MRNSYGWVGTSVGLFGVAKLFNAGKGSAATLLAVLLALGPFPLLLFFGVILACIIQWWIPIACVLVPYIAYKVVKAKTKPPALFYSKGVWYQVDKKGEGVRAVSEEYMAKYSPEARTKLQNSFFEGCITTPWERI